MSQLFDFLFADASDHQPVFALSLATPTLRSVTLAPEVSGLLATAAIVAIGASGGKIASHASEVTRTAVCTHLQATPEMSALLRYLNVFDDTVGLENTAVFFEIGIIKLTRRIALSGR
ncbi:hypothetical protein [Caballeronia sp. LZ035]|uniref:hypothetical protein n=1 Tax=Caballeronia sp. LZ035 TaxID=3038568 RepID=UPI00285E491A|nr:hypothetical protein [Caballeronia sp. LZ035]MDR5763231.1 hypothetical protein [Caballeronia sp. LZ035]